MMSYCCNSQERTTVAPPPPNTAELRTDKKVAVFGNRRYWESYIIYKTLIWDLEMGGGIGRGGIGGDDCTTIIRGAI